MPIPSGGGDAACAVRLLAIREDADGVVAAWVGRDGAVDDIQMGRTRAYSMGDEAGRSVTQRYYSSPIGRFLSPDPGGMKTANPRNPTSWNRYAYANDDPVNRIDPRGADSCFLGEAGGYAEGCMGAGSGDALPDRRPSKSVHRGCGQSDVCRERGTARGGI
jgi:RHS repeat-associated protein